MNTRIEYMYRDASNYKAYGEAVLRGTISESEKEAIGKALYDGEFFIPEEVGLDGLAGDLGVLDEEHDHPFHTIEGFFETEGSPTDLAPSAEEFVKLMLGMTQEKWSDAGVAWRNEKFGGGECII